ncbi:MAG TPA: PDDEXK nuclease domain-containing protein [Dongiaceae bacterium]|nr:PDDEXK nuclease domain-containing protein [Dongiaceae bacterium]
MPDITPLSADYAAWLADLKTRVERARQRAAVSVNRELVTLYWQIGRDILERQQQQGWGARVIDRLARDLRAAFPDMKGFSPRNLKYMRALAEAWPGGEFVQQPAAQLPWFHLCTLLDKLKTNELREWYAAQASEYGWSRNILVMQIETRLHERKGGAVTNFADRLPPAQSDLARETLKDPYIFDFLGLTEAAQEREIERALTQHITRFLLELGAGFAFVARQYRLEVGGDEFFIDLLFYHLKLRCYVVVELKTTPFKPEYAGQLAYRHDRGCAGLPGYAGARLPLGGPLRGLRCGTQVGRRASGFRLRQAHRGAPGRSPRCARSMPRARSVTRTRRPRMAGVRRSCRLRARRHAAAAAQPRDA